MKVRVLFNMLPTVNQRLGQHVRTGHAHLLLYFRVDPRANKICTHAGDASDASDDLWPPARKIKWQIALTLQVLTLHTTFSA